MVFITEAIKDGLTLVSYDHRLLRPLLKNWAEAGLVTRALCLLMRRALPLRISAVWWPPCVCSGGWQMGRIGPIALFSSAVSEIETQGREQFVPQNLLAFCRLFGYFSCGFGFSK